MEYNKDRIEVSITIYYNRCLYLILWVSILAIATLNKRKKNQPNYYFFIVVDLIMKILNLNYFFHDKLLLAVWTRSIFI